MGLSLVFLCLFIFSNTQNCLAFDKQESQALSHYMMGNIYDGQGDINKAIEEYAQALEKDNQITPTYLNLATSYLKKNDISAARGTLEKAIENDPEAVEPHAILALIYSLEKKEDLVSKEYVAALKNAAILEPENVEIYKNLGLVYLQENKFAEARGIYKIAATLKPLDAEIHFYLGDVNYKLNQKAEGEKELLLALKISPDYHEVLNYLGYSYLEEGRNIDQAGAMIRKALEFDTDNPAYVDSLGWFYFLKGQNKEAIVQLEKAVSLLDDPVIFDHLAEAYFKSKNFPAAKINWEKSLQLDASQDKVKEKLKKVMINIK